MSTMMTPITLRNGASDDLASVARIMSQAFDPRFGEAWSNTQCLGMLSLPGSWLTIAEVNDVTVGFALARRAFDECELLLLATHPDARGRGVGRALLRSVIVEARRFDAVTLHLEVRAGNKAIRLYRTEGFSKVGERRGYYRGAAGDLYDAHSFSRELS